MTGFDEVLRTLTRTLLRVIERDGFALAGAGAIREHGFLARPTQDIDLFTNTHDPTRFIHAIDRVLSELRDQGHLTDVAQRSDSYARLSVAVCQNQIEVDLGVDWRADNPVQISGIGPVLSLHDAIGNKVATLYSREVARDFLDVDAIRQSGRFTDETLLELAAQRDPGFDTQRFAAALARVERIAPSHVAGYGATPHQLAAIKDRMTNWSIALTSPAREQAPIEEIRRRADLLLRGRGASESTERERPLER